MQVRKLGTGSFGVMTQFGWARAKCLSVGKRKVGQEGFDTFPSHSRETPQTCY